MSANSAELTAWGRPVAELAEQQKFFDETGYLLIRSFFNEQEMVKIKEYLEEVQHRPEEVCFAYGLPGT